MTDAVRDQLRQHFLSGNTPDRWDDAWTQSLTPWDRGASNPALVDLLNTRHDLLGDPFTQGADGQRQRKKALVPGCGRGYDVLLLASFGYDAVGIDGSETAIEACKKLANEEADKYPLHNSTESRGNITFLVGDFFETNWQSSLHPQGGIVSFDLIYDYTFLCALPISSRPDWALRMSNLLGPSGRLICLEFPLHKDSSLGGPPFALRKESYEQHLARPGEELEYRDGLVVVKEVTSNVNGLIRLDRWMPARTHKIGEGTDHISVWVHP